VRNTRAERIWVDFVEGVGSKWKDFFYDLEENFSLNPDLPAHIWLLHWLFLESINEDVSEWVNMWNHHTLDIAGEPNRSPYDMFFFGILEGPRGVDHFLAPGSLRDYGVDYEIEENEELLSHFLENHWDDDDDNFDPFQSGLPVNMSEVVCEVIDSPFPPGFEEALRSQLDVELMHSRDMVVRRLLWQSALQHCHDLINGFCMSCLNSGIGALQC